VKISKLEGKRVALWGWGREGRAAFAVLRERLPTLPLSLFCPAAEVEAARAETGALDVRGEPSLKRWRVRRGDQVARHQPVPADRAGGAGRRAPASSAAPRCGSPNTRPPMASCTTPCA
jgi:UDP-N-acetylmuramoylalanine--D-glutamate ligase